MNQGNLLGFTVIRNISPGSSFPELRAKYIHETAYTVTAADLDWVLITTSGSATMLTLSAFGTRNCSAFHVAQQGVGQVTVSAASGAVIRTASTAKTRAQYSVISLMRLDPNEDQGNQWYLFGDME